MKKLILVPVLIFIFLVSCKKEHVEPIKQTPDPVSETMSLSKIKQTNSNIELIATLDNQTGEVSISSTETTQGNIYLTYRTFKESKGVLYPVSSMNLARYRNKFMLMAFNTIPPNTKYKVEIDVKYQTKDFKFVFTGKKK